MQSSVTDTRGVVEVLDSATYCKQNPGASVATCGYCGRSWDDSIPTGWTPAPAARCVFENDHEYPDDAA